MKSVRLTTPLRGARSMVEVLEFREPRFEDFMELGDPRVPIVSGDQYVWQPVPSLVRSYAERLLAQSGDVNLNIMAGASLRDSKAIQGAVLGFFMDLDQATSSGGSEENLPSEPKKGSETSAV